MGRIEYCYVTFENADEYLDDMQLRLGSFFDLAVNQCGMLGQRAAEIFCDSGIARKFELRTPKYISGMSGVELLERAFEACGIDMIVTNDQRWPTSPDYWVGYNLPAFQVSTGWSYKRLFETLDYDDVRGLHYRYADCSEDEFVQAVLRIIDRRRTSSRLQAVRKAARYTQGQLADMSGVSLRSIQMYEQGKKDINHAAADTVRRLAVVLCCSMEDLME